MQRVGRVDMLTPQLITEAADIYKRIKDLDTTLDRIADSVRFGLWAHDNRGSTTATVDVGVSQDAYFTASARAALLDHFMKKRAVLERRLRQIGAPVPELLEG